MLSKHARAGVIFALVSGAALAAEPDFSGHWSVDLRTGEQRAREVMCGAVEFTLHQEGEQITGNHRFASPGCARRNDGFEGSVHGIAVGSTAVLEVTSGRNGAVVLGRATLRGKQLYWTTVTELKPGKPEGDALILNAGTLTRQ